MDHAENLDALWPLIAARMSRGSGSIGGFLPFYRYDGVDGTARIVVPDGARDVTKYFWCAYVVAEVTGAGTAVGTANVAPGGSAILYNDGTDRLQLACSAGGQVTLQRTAGTDTFQVVLLSVWL